jgi:TetR/AcrR family transcriptional regulator
MTRKSDLKTGSRQKVYDAALEEFARHGLAGARVDRIAQMANVNKAMIYYHFGSKEKLYRAMFEEGLRQASSGMLARITAGEDIESILLAISKTQHNLFASDKRYAAVYLHEAAAGGKHLKAALRRILSRGGFPRKLKKMIEEGKRARDFRDIDSTQAMLSFIGMNMFYILLAPIANSVWEIKNEKTFKNKRPAAVVDLFMHGLKK